MQIRTFALLAALALPAPLLANSYTYYYTGGAAFNEFSANGETQVYTTSDSVSGEFTVSTPLAYNLNSGNPADPRVSISPISFSFTDGYQTITNLSANLDVPDLIFEFETDASGTITDDWLVQIITLTEGAPSNFVGTQSFNGVGNDYGVFDQYYDQSSGGYDYASASTGGISSSGGTWSTTPPASTSATPEPSTLTLLGTGLLGLAGIARRRFLTASA